MTSTVLIKPIAENMKDSIRECFDLFGGIDSIVKGNVFIKPNGTACDKYRSAMTSPEVIEATVELIRKEATKAKEIYVFENSALTMFTRMVFTFDNLAKRIKKAGGIPLYLDEQRSVDVDFHGKCLDKPIPIPKIIHEQLIEKRAENTYINVPKLKSHTQCDVTICLKNQHGFLYYPEKIYHHHMMDEKIVDIMRVFKPDFNIVDATTVCDYGPVAYKPEWVIPMGLLLAGKDPVAVDTVGARLIGFNNVRHIQLAACEGFGTNNLDEIDVMPSRDLIDKYTTQLHSSIDIPMPSNIVYIQGKERGCEHANHLRQGCCTLETALRVVPLGEQYGPCVGITAKGHDTKELDTYTGPFIVSGPCAVEELKPYFERRADRRKIEVYYLNEHMDLAEIAKTVNTALRIPTKVVMRLSPFGMPRILALYLSAKLHGVQCKLAM